MTEQELEVYFRQMNDLFRTEGWGLLVEDFKQQVPNINSVEQAKTIEELYFRKGQLNIIGSILNLEETNLRGQESLSEDANV
jgi:cyclopropane fatty-acyl-phospholipid synthase-like methyltransferase